MKRPHRYNSQQAAARCAVGPLHSWQSHLTAAVSTLPAATTLAALAASTAEAAAAERAQQAQQAQVTLAMTVASSSARLASTWRLWQLFWKPGVQV
jgi:hypothetical protein